MKLATCALLALTMSSPLRAQTVQAPDAVTERANSLLDSMSPEEKMGQLSQLFYFGAGAMVPGGSPVVPIEDTVARGGVGSLLFVTDPAVIDRLQHVAVEKSPHHIPLIFGYDVIHGFRTIFPVPLAMAASWDPAMVTKSQTIAAMEARSVGIEWAFGPMVDIARDPRWGRIVEGAGEDPYLGSAIAAAQVRGYQGDTLGARDHVVASVKHFAGYGAAEGGRDYDGSYISDAQLYNVYLPPFHAAVKAGAGTLMSAYMDLNDVPATGNRWLLTDVLRRDWGFQGFVVSDADAVKSLVKHGFAKDFDDAAVRAFTAGVNMEMALGASAYSTGLPKALAAGTITPSALDTAVRPILETKLKLGLFEHPYADQARSTQILAAPEHREAARIAAERSAVLLRNEGSLLPLKAAAYKKIAVLGPLADSKLDTLGSWAFQQNLAETVTVLEGLRTKLAGAAEISYAPGVQLRRVFPSFLDAITHAKDETAWTPAQALAEMKKAIDIASRADLVVLVIGEAQNMSGEQSSRESLDLPDGEETLLEAAVATGKPVVLVLMNGRPLDITWASTHVPAILEAWYPGTQGGNAIANLLTGAAVPAGKLPLSWPRNVGQIPINYAHNITQAPENQGQRYWDEQSTPLYPFGYGLSYSTFTFSNLQLGSPFISTRDRESVTVDVANTGSLAADEVVQIYIHQQYGSASRPVRELKGFERIALAPGEKRTVHFALGHDERMYWSAASHSWTDDPSTYDVWAGGDSTAALHAEFRVK